MSVAQDNDPVWQGVIHVLETPDQTRLVPQIRLAWPCGAVVFVPMDVDLPGVVRQDTLQGRLNRRCPDAGTGTGIFDVVAVGDRVVARDNNQSGVRGWPAAEEPHALIGERMRSLQVGPCLVQHHLWNAQRQLHCNADKWVITICASRRLPPGIRQE